MRRDLEAQIPQHFRTKPIAQTDIFESDQAQLRSEKGANPAAGPIPPQSREIEFASLGAVMVSDSLTDAA
ncbi:hypothetical protein CRBSH125_14750 [Afipia carboxidovorans]|nr:hypothetical protein CRBSH125_14750 [Afipia carboxidovorans]